MPIHQRDLRGLRDRWSRGCEKNIRQTAVTLGPEFRDYCQNNAIETLQVSSADSRDIS
jgi:hypothetical protein